MVFCHECGQEDPGDFCETCGAEALQICLGCEILRVENAAYCWKCGEPFEEEEYEEGYEEEVAEEEAPVEEEDEEEAIRREEEAIRKEEERLVLEEAKRAEEEKKKKEEERQRLIELRKKKEEDERRAAEEKRKQEVERDRAQKEARIRELKKKTAAPPPRRQGRQCPSCSFSLKITAKFCPKCGAKSDPNAPPPSQKSELAPEVKYNRRKSQVIDFRKVADGFGGSSGRSAGRHQSIVLSDIPQERCASCSRELAFNEDNVFFNEKFFHHGCFVCCVCSAAFDENSQFQEKDGQIYCESDFASQFGGGGTCVKCGDALGNDFVELGGSEAWHFECFSCTSCNVSFEGSSCLNVGGKPYCDRCGKKVFIQHMREKKKRRAR